MAAQAVAASRALLVCHLLPALLASMQKNPRNEKSLPQNCLVATGSLFPLFSIRLSTIRYNPSLFAITLLH